MKYLPWLPLALGVSALLLSNACGAEVSRRAGWCGYDAAKGETFPPSRMNLPAWACVKADALHLQDTYSVRTILNPFFLTGDFNCDGNQDVALWVEHLKSHKVGIIIIHGGNAAHVVIGAGVDWDKRGQDYSWTDIWRIEPKGTAFQSAYEGDRRVVTKGEAIILTKSESAAFAVYWSGTKYRSYQLSD
jgi:hypothetical protein